MLSKTTHVYAHSESGGLKLDVYLPTDCNKINVSDPAFIYFHGGGLVAYNRELIPTHIVQSCVRRNWPLISVDYNLLPQARGKDLLSHIRHAHRFVRKRLSSIIGRGDETWERIVVGGNSAGAYMAYQAGLYLDPKPLSIFGIYGLGNCQAEFWNSNHIIGNAPISQSEVAHFFERPISTGRTPSELVFHPESLLDDGSVNPDFQKPVNLEKHTESSLLYNWLVQENALPPLLSDIEVPFSSSAWKDYPQTIIIHGTNDDVVPYQAAIDLLEAISPGYATLFPVRGAGHAFDVDLLLGDEGLEMVDRAWDALDEIIRKSKTA